MSEAIPLPAPESATPPKQSGDEVQEMPQVLEGAKNDEPEEDDSNGSTVETETGLVHGSMATNSAGKRRKKRSKKKTKELIWELEAIIDSTPSTSSATEPLPDRYLKQLRRIQARFSRHESSLDENLRPGVWGSFVEPDLVPRLDAVLQNTESKPNNEQRVLIDETLTQMDKEYDILSNWSALKCDERDRKRGPQKSFLDYRQEKLDLRQKVGGRLQQNGSQEVQ
ncbi:MAG: hypothetical protein MMC23_007851 [Stictis urceolatum]|nr:hypothetical protein [Stictis urceolata]